MCVFVSILSGFYSLDTMSDDIYIVTYLSVKYNFVEQRFYNGMILSISSALVSLND